MPIRAGSASLGLALCLLLLSPGADARSSEDPGASATGTLPALRAPGLSASTLALALRAYHRAEERRLLGRKRLTVIDYSLPSTAPRLWVLDPERGEVLFTELVAHGRGSGELVPDRFGNTPQSHRSSLGVFRTAETYRGAHGYSLRIDGLDKGVNDRARARDLVFHAAGYATEAFGQQHGRLGRSHGCPALPPATSRQIIDEIRGGSLVVAVGPDSRWVETSPLARGG
jgi:hypothetical protein